MTTQPAARDEPTTPSPSAEAQDDSVIHARKWMQHSFPGAKLFDNRVESLARLIDARVAEAVERERAGCGNLIHASISDHDSSDVKQALIWCVASIRERKP